MDSRVGEKLVSRVPPPRRAAGDRGAAIFAALIVTLRSVVFVAYEQAHFDSDQAVFGLMAKHLAELRAFPLFMYGQDYLLAVEAWLAAPLFAVAGPSVTALKLPILALNIAAVLLLIRFLRRDGRLTGGAALLAALYFAVPGVVTASRLVEAAGGNIEPFVWVLLIWATRRHALLLGAVAALGVLNREFTLYGVVALLLVEGVRGTLFTRARARDYLRATLVAAAVAVIVVSLRPVSNESGPGTRAKRLTAGPAPERVCWDASLFIGNARWLVTENLPTVFGARQAPAATFFRTRNDTGRGWLWPLLTVIWTLLAVRTGVFLVRSRAPEDRQRLEFPVYLVIVGAGAAGGYLLGCDVRDGMLIRYTLLALLIPVGLTAAHLMLEPRRVFRGIGMGLAILSASTAGFEHARLAAEYWTRPPRNVHRALAAHLEQRGVRFAYAGYWDAYVLTFLTNERLIVTSQEPVRILDYAERVDRNRSEAVTITRAPCASGGEVFGPWNIC